MLAGMLAPASGIDGAPVVRDHRMKPVVRDHRTKRKNEVVHVNRKKLSCQIGFVQLYKMGYQSVFAYDCRPPVYHYTARENASLFRASMNAYSGAIDTEFIGLAGSRN